ncbi:SHOCT domain-containing protein [Streptomyces silvisoli]|uniref:SHOCT domain-containing protein n=1 Tax=Streptomyces silvisoli TaxID=3034235 RepID=UPI0037038834
MGRPHAHIDAPSPEQLLAERFARGEIDEYEYRRRLATLRDASSPHHESGP